MCVQIIVYVIAQLKDAHRSGEQKKMGKNGRKIPATASSKLKKEGLGKQGETALKEGLS